MNIQGINQQPVGPGSLSRVTVTSKTPASEPTAAPNEEANQVSISSAGRQALASEIGGVLHAKANDMQAAQQSEAEKPAKLSIEEMIEQRKEKIKALQQELKALASDKSEAADKRRTEIRTEIAVLSAQIADLMKQKAENDKKSSST